MKIMSAVDVFCKYCNRKMRTECDSNLQADTVKYSVCKDCKITDAAVEYELKKHGLLGD